MDFQIIGLGYLDGAHVVTVTLAAYDDDNVRHTIQAQWPADEISEFASLSNKAIEQVGGDLVLIIERANKTLPPIEPAKNVIKPDDKLSATIESRRQEILDEEARLRKEQESVEQNVQQ